MRGVPAWQRLVAAVGLVALSPVLAAVAAALRIAAGRPVLYRAERIGAGGRSFTMYKFRTMRRDAASRGAITARADGRVHRLGRLLRRFKLDELPQLVNVVRGQMSLVGPRPEDPGIVERHYRPWMMETLTVPPGITSPGTVGYFLSETELPCDADAAEEHYARLALPRKLAVDLVYVRQRSWRYDLDVLLRTGARLLAPRRPPSSRERREVESARRILAEAGEAM